MKLIFGTILSIAILYAWGGLIFGILRLRFDGSEEEQRRFLKVNFRYFTNRIIKPAYPEVSPKVIREKGAAGWSMIWLPIISFGFGFTFWNAILGASLLFFGGLLFAKSWYGLRCLRCLGLDSFTTRGPHNPAIDKPDPLSS